ncbi:MAG: hypothetical protein FJ144_13875 [Deltaproteobacteria bacterium]|nr:hypothetical protein [Deltaproteobacteria bacterium]
MAKSVIAKETSRETPETATDGSRLLPYLLPASVFLSGAVIMVLEVLGTRLIAPVYGTSLYVWSALIAVTLLSLSIGYWLGGWVADRFPSPAVYFAIFEVAAILVVAVRFVREPVVVATLALGLRGGAVAAAAPSSGRR